MSYHICVKRRCFIFCIVGSSALTSNIIPYSNGLDALPPVVDTVKMTPNATINSTLNNSAGVTKQLLNIILNRDSDKNQNSTAGATEEGK